ncbi:MAG: hypothetical protein K6T90_14525 [Leptolyngbyaceae cyanobacterium HOT.MB2.61]|nr:hypothetical protein [Leptolyngbyaceae cyanobacterium HOT.MB2.61]
MGGDILKLCVKVGGSISGEHGIVRTSAAMCRKCPPQLTWRQCNSSACLFRLLGSDTVRQFLLCRMLCWIMKSGRSPFVNFRLLCEACVKPSRPEGRGSGILDQEWEFHFRNCEASSETEFELRVGFRDTNSEMHRISGKYL